MRNKSLIAVVFVGWGVFWGCEDERLNQGRPRLEVEPAALNFKTLNIGERDSRKLLLKNTGTASLQIDGMALEGDGVFSLDSLDETSFEQVSFPIGISPPVSGQTVASTKSLQVSFSSAALGEYSGLVNISSNDGERPRWQVPLSGVCAVPDIEVTPAQLDFGGVRLNSSSVLQLTVKNNGQSDLVISLSDLSLESGKDSAFLYTAHDMRISEDQADIVQVIYAPKEPLLDPQTHQPIPHRDALLIASNDPDENPVRIPLSGLVQDNLRPLATLRVVETLKLDGTPLADPCDIATSDTTKLSATVVDPEGAFVQPSNLVWLVPTRPLGSQRNPTAVPGEYQATFRPDMYGDYVLCVQASDPQGNKSDFDPATACTCQEANAQGADDFLCPCVRFTSYPREDIRIELIWDLIGPDLDLHLAAPGVPATEFCVPSRECRFNPVQEDPNWNRFACVPSGDVSICRTPNCDPVLAGCLPEQVCFDNDDSGPEPPTCYWKRCSSRHCYWDSRNPDWGVLGDERDDPLLAIDCTKNCRAENINLNRPEPGSYRLWVNYYQFGGNTRATVRIFFKGDLVPSAEFSTMMTATCDTWKVAYIEWLDPENHQVLPAGDAHEELCCR